MYAARLRLGRFLPVPLVAVLSFLRGFAASLAGGGYWDADATAPSWVLITRRSDDKVVGKLSAGREPYAGEMLLQSVRTSMSELGPEDFLRRWHIDTP